MKPLYCILLLAGMLVSHYAPAQSWQWAKNFRNNEETVIPNMVKDPAGNLILSSTALLAKYDASGNLLWQKDPFTGFVARVTDVSTDTAGNIIIVGIFSDTLSFDTISVVGPGLTDIFVVKYNGAGNVLWTKVISTSGLDNVNDVSTDKSGNIFVSGFFPGSSITIDTTTLMGTSDASTFLVKYAPTGSLIWGRALSCAGASPSYCIPKAMTVDNNGDVILSGDYTGTTMTIGTTTLTATVGTYLGDVFVAKYSSTGNVLWAKGIASDDYDAAFDIATDAAGNSFLIGHFTGYNLYADAFHLINTSTSIKSDVFVVSYDPLGNVRWLNRLGTAGNNEGRAIATDNAGNVYVAAYYLDSTISFGPNLWYNSTIGPAGPTGVNAIVAKYANLGSELWSVNIGGNVAEVVNALVTDNTGNVFVYGMTASSTLTLGPITLTSTGSFYGDYFLAKLSQTTSVNYTAENSKSIILYPNPVSDVVTIKSQEPIKDISIVDILGKQLEHFVGSANEVNIHTSRLAPGLYHVIINNSTVKQFTKR